MKELIEERIKELKSEYENGQKLLGDLDVKRTSLNQTLLRISGAIQALEEIIPEEKVAE